MSIPSTATDGKTTDTVWQPSLHSTEKRPPEPQYSKRPIKRDLRSEASLINSSTVSPASLCNASKKIPSATSLPSFERGRGRPLPDRLRFLDVDVDRHGPGLARWHYRVQQFLTRRRRFHPDVLASRDRHAGR